MGALNNTVISVDRSQARAPHRAHPTLIHSRLFKTPFSMHAAGGGPQKYTRAAQIQHAIKPPFQCSRMTHTTEREKRRPPEQKRRQSEATITQKRAPVCSVTQQKSRAAAWKSASQPARLSLIFQPCMLRGEKDHNSLRNVLFIYLSCDVYLLPCVSERAPFVRQHMQIHPKYIK